MSPRAAAVGCCLAFVLGVPRAAGEAVTPEPLSARWVAYDLTVWLRHLERRYSCEDLRRKLRSVLLQIGAAASPHVSISRCEASLGEFARSPRVRLQFELLKLMSDNPVVDGLVATRRRVRISPGNPESLDGRDCGLLRQVYRFVLRELPLQISEFNLACSADPRYQRFWLSIGTLVPLSSE